MTARSGRIGSLFAAGRAGMPGREAPGEPPLEGAAVITCSEEDSTPMSASQSQAVTAAETVRRARCSLCRARPGRACTRRGDHLARWLGACSAGRITRGDLRDVIAGLVVVTHWSVITEEGAG